MPITENELAEYELQEEERQEAAAGVVPPIETPQLTTEVETPNQAAYGENAAQPKELESGIVTKIGEGIGYALKSDGATADLMNAAAAIPKALTSGLDEDNILRTGAEAVDKFILGSEESKAAELQHAERSAIRRASGEAGVVESTLDTTANILESQAAALESTIALPFTIAAWIEGSARPWAKVPDTLKYSPVGSVLFEIGQVLYPTLAMNTVLPGSGAPSWVVKGGTSVLGESVIESFQDESLDDTLFGRYIAEKFGQLVEVGFPGQGGETTRRILENEALDGKVLNFILSTFQNVGFNLAGQGIFNLGKYGYSKALKNIDELDVFKLKARNPQGEVDSLNLKKRIKPVSEDDVEKLSFDAQLIYQGEEGIGVVTKTQELPNGSKLKWIFTRLDEPALQAGGATTYNFENIKDISTRQYSVEWTPVNLTANPGRHNVRLRSWANQTVQNNLEPGDILMNNPGADFDYDNISKAQLARNEAADIARASRKIAAIEESFNTSDESWQYLGDLLGLPEKDEVLNYWKGLNDAQKLEQADDMFDFGAVKEPDMSDLDADIRAKLYGRLGFSWPPDPDRNYQWAVVRKFPGKNGVMLSPLNVKLDYDTITRSLTIKNVKEVREIIEAAKNVKPLNESIPSKLANRLSRIVKRNPKVIQESLEDVETPQYRPDLEPHEANSLDAGANLPSDGNQFINEDALLAEAIRDNSPGARDSAQAADEFYFSNLEAVEQQEGLQQYLIEATRSLRKLVPFLDDWKTAEEKALDIWERMGPAFGIDTDGVPNEVLEIYREVVAPLDLGSAAKPPRDLRNVSTEKVLRNLTAVKDEGFIVAQLAARKLGIRLQKLAKLANNLEVNNLDFTYAVQQYSELLEKAQLFMIPLRRGKRRWAVNGWSQNPKKILELKNDPDVLVKKLRNNTLDPKAPAREFETLTKEADIGHTFNEYWEMYKAGNQEAGETVKAWIQGIAYADPETSLAQVDNIANILRDQIKNGRANGVQSIHYGLLLSRMSTQIASLYSGLAQGLLEPLGSIKYGLQDSLLKGRRWDEAIKESEDVAYGLGQWQGGWAYIQEGLNMARRSWKADRSLVGGNKINADIKVLRGRQVALDEAVRGIRQLHNQQGADGFTKLGVTIDYLIQTLGNHPWMHVGMRGLTAVDNGLTTVLGFQDAAARAWKEAAQNDNYQDLKRIWDRNIKMMFDENGVLIDDESLARAKKITFQDEIPTDGGMIDNVFLGIQRASNSSAFFKFYAPFNRVTHSTLESAARHSLIGLVPDKKWFGFLPNKEVLLPKYHKILAGEMGETAQQQLRSQIALGHLFVMGVVSASLAGLQTGKNPPYGMPKDSWIIPAPGTEEGWFAVPYSRFAPYNQIMSFTADLVNGLKDEVLTRGQYDRYLEELLFSVGMNTLDTSFTSGLQDMTELTDVQNWKRKNFFADAAAGFLGSFSGGRMVGDILQPYKTLSKTDYGWEQFFANVRQRAFGGLGNPIDYNEITGLPRLKRLQAFGGQKDDPGEGYLAYMGAGLVNELTFHSKIQSAGKGRDFILPNGEKVNVMKKMALVGFKPDYRWLTKVEGQSLTLKEQSILKKGMADIGKLEYELAKYFNSFEFKQNWRLFQQFRRDINKPEKWHIFRNSAGKEPRAVKDGKPGPQFYLREIHRAIQKRYNEAKWASANGTLFQDPDFQAKLQAAKIHRLQRLHK